jgi:hypothetical protein
MSHATTKKYAQSLFAAVICATSLACRDEPDPIPTAPSASIVSEQEGPFLYFTFRHAMHASTVGHDHRDRFNP